MRSEPPWVQISSTSKIVIPWAAKIASALSSEK